MLVLQNVVFSGMTAGNNLTQGIGKSGAFSANNVN